MDSRNLKKETINYTPFLLSSQCKLHSRLALQIKRGMEERSSTLEGPCTHFSNWDRDSSNHSLTNAILVTEAFTLYFFPSWVCMRMILQDKSSTWRLIGYLEFPVQNHARGNLYKHWQNKCSPKCINIIASQRLSLIHWVLRKLWKLYQAWASQHLHI